MLLTEPRPSRRDQSRLAARHQGRRRRVKDPAIGPPGGILGDWGRFASLNREAPREHDVYGKYARARPSPPSLEGIAPGAARTDGGRYWDRTVTSAV